MNILFFKHSTIDPLKGGIDRVSSVLYTKFKESHNVYALMLQKTTDCNNPCFFYTPNKDNECSKENLEFAEGLIKDLKIDIIINQDGISPNSSKFILNVSRGNAKLISVLHSDLSCIYGISEKIPSWLATKIPHFLIQFANNAMNIFFRYKYKQYWDSFENKNDAICILDESLRESTAKFIGMSNKYSKICCVNNPVTLKIPSKNETDKKKKNILYVGRLSPEKNLLSLLKIWKIVEDKNPDWNLIIVGDGKCMDELNNYKKKNNLRHVAFKGQQDPTAYYAEASIFCLTSFFEGLPLVIIEAMSYGCIPIAFNSFATAQSLIENGKNGFLISPYDIKKFAQILDFLMNNPNSIQTIALDSFKSSQKYSIDRIVFEWNELFDKITHENKLYT